MFSEDDFKKYKINPEDGTVYSLVTNRFVGSKTKKGYMKVTMYDNNGTANFFQVHRLIWMSVHGEIPDGMEINHIDEDKTNNSISNLNLMTRKQNVNWGSGIQRRADSQRGKKRPNTSFKMKGKLINRLDSSKQVGKYSLAGVLLEVFPSTAEAHRRCGYSSGQISRCCNGKINRYRGFLWRYVECNEEGEHVRR